MRVLFAVLLTLSLMVVPALAEDDVGHDDWYGQLQGRAGYLLSLRTNDAVPYVTVPTLGYKKATFEIGGAFDIDPGTEAVGLTQGLLACTFHFGNLKKLGVKFDWAKYVDFNAGPYVSYDFVEERVDGGVLLSFVGADFDDGNGTLQREQE